ncbi:hypothetical protein UlMin_031474 [Ulmus minor]
MAVSQADAKRKYSWWWDSHISPKNSKWLQENLTDMDSKVKQMIKLIEEDADSFARRAEMYYKKRPELMKLVEEFYRAYRALAERYDHATGVIRQAHRTMAEAFPNQVPMVFSDESPGGSEPHTPEMPPLLRAMFECDELQKDALGLSSSHFHAAKRNGAFNEEPDSVMSRKGLKQLNDLFGSAEAASHVKFAEGRARKGLNFHDVEVKDRNVENNGKPDHQAQAFTESDRVGKAETEISNLKEALAKLEAEKEAGLLEYEKSMQRLTNLEYEVSRAQGDSRDLNERANKAETEVQNLKEVLTKLQVEREASLLQYQQYLEKISNLENRISYAERDARELNERASKAEIEAETLKQELARITAEKESALVQHKQCLEVISNLEDRLLQAQEDAKQLNERADKAECEVEALKQAIAKLTEEKEVAALQYLQCLERISDLEQKLSSAQEESQRLNAEINEGVAKLKGAEEKCVLLEKSNNSMQSELETLVQKVGSQGEELTEKQKELGRLWTCIQEERMRFVEAETAFQTLQHLHSQSQEELRSLVKELQNRAEILNNMKTLNQGLEDEVQKVKEENKSLNELNSSSALSVQNLQDEILNLREKIKKLEEEVDLRVDERNALQQEIYCLKEEIKDLSKKHHIMLDQVESVGFNSESFGLSVKELQDENAKLKQICESNQIEKITLLGQLETMEKLMVKNALLENSIADLNVELDGVREKVKALEESCQSLLEEKSTLIAEKTSLISHLQITTENLEKLSEKNNLLENSLFDANAELEGLRVKSTSLEDLCLLLDSEKSSLTNEKERLVSQLDISHQRLEDLGNVYAELQEKLSTLEKERESALYMVEELGVSLDNEKQEHANFTQLSQTQLADMELQIHYLQEQALCRKKEYEEEQDKAFNAHTEILVLQKCIEDLEEKIVSLLMERQKLLEASSKSEKLISELEHKFIEQQMEIKSLSEHNKVLEMGVYQVMKTLGIDADEVGQDQTHLNHAINKLKETQDSLLVCSVENQQLVIEKTVILTLLGQLESEGANLMTDRNTLDQDFRIQSEQLLVLQGEAQRLWQTSEELKLKVVDGDQREEALTSKLENLHKQLSELQESCQNLQEENCKVLEEKGSLKKEVLDLEEEKYSIMFGETIFHSNLSLVFNDIISAKLEDLKELSEKLDKLRLGNKDLEEKVIMLEGKLEALQMENLLLQESLDKSDGELIMVKSVSNQLTGEITIVKDLLSQRENEIQLLEGQAEALFGELQISKVYEALLEGKIHELTETCESLEDRSNSKARELEILNERVDTLEGTNGGLQADLVGYTSAVIALKKCIASLEKHAGMPTEPEKLDCEESEDTHLVTPHADICQRGQDQTVMVPNGIADLQDMQRRIKAIEEAMAEKDRIAVLENVAATTKLVAAIREIDELKTRSSLYQENGQSSRHVMATRDEEESNDGVNYNLKVQTGMHEISEAGSEVLTKDIMLDQISDSSSYERSKRVNGEANHRMLEYWETTNVDDSIDLQVAKAQKLASASTDRRQIEAVKSHRSRNPSVESLIEKELGVDRLELSKRFSESRQEGNKKRILERLDSDVQKLSNLQITVQDLRRKVDITEKSKKGKSVEYDSVKGQLEEAEESITKLFDVNRKLLKNLEDGAESSEGVSSAVSDETGSVRRRRISEQARRGSEKIGRLQLEVQRLQFLLLKLDEEKESKAKTRITDRRTRVLLRDYLYGGGVRTGRKPKKATFCSCVQPPTKGD